MDALSFGFGLGLGMKNFGGGGPVGPQAVILPTPSFGSANLLGWWDVTKTYVASDGAVIPAVDYDNLGYSSVSYLEDISGNGASWLQGDKSIQPLKGPSGGPVFSDALAVMNCMRRDLYSNRSALSHYMQIRPLAGTAKRTVIYGSRGTPAQAAKAAAIATPGSAYAVGDYITLTGATVLKVMSVDGAGGVTSIAFAAQPATTTPPANPVAQTSVARPQSTSPGTGFTANLTYPIVAVSGGGTTERYSVYLNNGTGGRKATVTSMPLDAAGTAVATTPANTSVGAPNGAALADTSTFHRVGIEDDLAGGSIAYFQDGLADGVQTRAAGITGDAESVLLRLGNNNTPNAPGAFELLRLVILAEIPSSSRRAQIDTYLNTGV